MTLSNLDVARLSRAEQVARNRDLLLDAARRVFLARGYAGASLDAIADEAGFSIGAVYSQFGSKADLFLALLDRRIDMRAMDNERVAKEFVGAEGLRELLHAGRADAAAEPGWQHVLAEFRAVAMREPGLNRRYSDVHARTIDGIASTLEKLYEPIGLTPPVPVRSLAEFLQAGTVGAALERAANPCALPDRDAELLIMRALGFEGHDD